MGRLESGTQNVIRALRAAAVLTAPITSGIRKYATAKKARQRAHSQQRPTKGKILDD